MVKGNASEVHLPDMQCYIPNGTQNPSVKKCSICSSQAAQAEGYDDGRKAVFYTTFGS
jgi:hypothetical protein